MRNPLVSVILPVFNGERYVVDAMNCVLSQKYRPLELIVIDDGSTDNTASLTSGYAHQIRYFFQSNSGPAAARNLAIQKAKGEFIAFIDSDDLWPEEKLTNQMECFQEFPEADIVQGLIRKIPLSNVLAKDPKDQVVDFHFIYTNLGSMVIRKSVFDLIGVFDENLVFHEDTDLWLRAREANLKILVQQKEALIYRIHGGNLTAGKDIVSTNYLGILRKSINRRREVMREKKDIPKLTFISGKSKEPVGTTFENRSNKHIWPLVSVIIYGCENLQRTIKALESVINQNYPCIQLIITGENVEKIQIPASAQSLGVQYVENRSTDTASTLNTAVESSDGQYIGFLSADAEWASGKLRARIAALEEIQNYGFCVGRTRQIIDPKMKYAPELIDSLAFRKSLGDLLDTILVHKNIFEKVGGFRNGLSGMVEMDWILRARDTGVAPVMLPDVLLYRYIETNLNPVDAKILKTALLESLHSSIKRKRNDSEKNS